MNSFIFYSNYLDNALLANRLAYLICSIIYDIYFLKKALVFLDIALPEIDAWYYFTHFIHFHLPLQLKRRKAVTLWRRWPSQNTSALPIHQVTGLPVTISEQGLIHSSLAASVPDKDKNGEEMGTCKSLRHSALQPCWYLYFPQTGQKMTT